jgi:uncharacterized protein
MTRAAVATLALLLAAWAPFACARSVADGAAVATGASSPATLPGAPADCPADPPPFTRDEAVAALHDAVDSGFLWKATRDGHASYLYGTIHIARRAWQFPGPRVQAALAASNVLALELDLTDPDVIGRYQRLVARKPGAPELPAALGARLNAQMAAACVNPATVAGLRPEMRAVTVELMGRRRDGLLPAYGIDLAIAGLAVVQHTPVRALETPESQLALLVSDDPAVTLRTVSDVLDELESGDSARILDRLADDWHRGDLDDLGAYGHWCDCLNTPEQRADFAKLVDERNPLMADKIAQWHAEGKSLFVAVGSLHMTGDIGLPQLLRAKGFVVERVAF